MLIERKLLTQMLALAARVATNKPTLPILGYVLLEPGPESVRLSVTDLEMAAVVELPAGPGDSDDARVAIPVKPFLKLVKALPKDVTSVDLAVTASYRVMFHGFSVEGMNPDDFPTIVVPTTGALAPAALAPPHTTVIATPGLLDALAKVECAVSTDETRYSLNAVFLRNKVARTTAHEKAEAAASFDVVATNGHTLHMTECAGALPGDGLLLPGKFVRALLANRALVQTPASLIVADAGEHQAAQIAMPLTHGVLVTRPLDAQFPNYAGIIPRPGPVKLKVQRAVFLAAVTTALRTTDTLNAALTFVLSKSRVMVATFGDNDNDGNPVLTCELEIPGAKATKPGLVVVNGRYLRDALTVCTSDTPTITLRYDGYGPRPDSEPSPDLPAVIRPLLITEPGFLSLIMPMRGDQRAERYYRRLMPPPAAPPAPNPEEELSATTPA